MLNKEGGGLPPNIENDSILRRKITLQEELIRCEEEGVTVATGINPIGENYAYPLLPQEMTALGNERFRDVTYRENVILYLKTVGIITGQDSFGKPYAYAEMSVRSKYPMQDYRDYRYSKFDPFAKKRDIVDLDTGRLFEDHQYGSPRGRSIMPFGNLEELNRMRAKAGLEELDEYPEI